MLDHLKDFKRLRLLMLGAWALGVLALGWSQSDLVQATVGAPHGALPVITDMSFSRRVVEVSGMATWYLYFTDRDKDVNWVRFEEFNGSDWMDVGQFSPADSHQSTGKIMVVTRCARVAVSLARVWLYDKAENKSEPYYYVVDCQQFSGRASIPTSSASEESTPQETSRGASALFAETAPHPGWGPIRYQGEGIDFDLDGLAVHESQVQVFDLGGRPVFTGVWEPSMRPRWNLLDNQGQPVSNGVYLIVIAAKGFDEQIRRIGPRKVVILR